MEENKNAMKKLDDLDDEIKRIKRHRDMTEGRENKRRRILKGAILGAGIALTTGGIAGCSYIVWLMNFAPVGVAGGAMGQWEEIPLQPEESAAKFSKVCERMRIG